MRSMLYIIAAFTMVAGAIAALGPAAAEAVTLRGKARIVAGDRLAVAGVDLRLDGIIAPARGQVCRLDSGKPYDCGRISATALMDLTAGAGVVCILSGKMRDGVVLAKCRAGGYDLSKGMVHAGWALSWPRGRSAYGAVEAASRRARHGLWRGRFDMPWDWRRGVRVVGTSADPDR